MFLERDLAREEARISTLKRPGRHKLKKNVFPRNLFVQITETGGRSFLLRYQINGKCRWLGLGPIPKVTLRTAIEEGHKARELISRGIDPLDQKAKQAAALKSAITFEQAARQYHAQQLPTWSNPKHAQQFLNTLTQYAFPRIGAKPVALVDTGDVLAVIDPIWLVKTETANRVHGRIEKVLDWSAVRGHRSPDLMNPARWSGHLSNTLPARFRVAKVEHYPALPYPEAPAFMVDLRAQEGISPLALEFTILTMARTGEVIGPHWPEIDLAQKVWTVPAGRMKGEREHRVPLSTRAVKILQSLPREEVKPRHVVAID